MSNRVLRSFTDLRPATEIETVFFVLRRQNGPWSTASTVMSVHSTEPEAEAAATALKKNALGSQHFGVAALRSEARDAVAPIEIVRVPSGDAKTMKVDA